MGITKEIITGAGVTAFIALSIFGGVECCFEKARQPELKQEAKQSQIESNNHAAQFLEDKLKEETKGMNYKEFLEVTGMERELSSEYDNCNVWTNVYTKNDYSMHFSIDKTHQRVSAYPNIVNILIPYNKEYSDNDASGILRKIKPPKPSEFIGGFP